MRTLLLMRGAPGAGKSTWIREHGLQNYTVCPDDIRLLCSTPELQATGEVKISQNQKNEQQVWKILFQLLEYRMSRGEFTVVDATCSKTRDMQQYKDLANQYRYRIYIVDFTTVPLATCLTQNKMRPAIKQVPQEAIENVYSRFATQKIPTGISVIQPNEFETLFEKPLDVSNYKKLVFIGDIHGRYATLMQYPDFRDGLKDDTEYIFLGDYIDRGNQNYEVLEFLDKIKDLPNVCLLEGNHERWLQDFGNDIPAKSKEFEEVTKVELLANNYDTKKARMLYRKCRQFSHITYKGLEILACHGGIPNLNTNALFLPTDSFIHGVGTYADYLTIAESWMGQTKENQFLLHGHRNVEDDECRIADRVFNLEGKVEFGGKLRIVELASVSTETADSALPNEVKWKVIELNDCQPITETLNTEQRKVESVEEAVAYLKHNKYVQEKDLGNGISSFNFTRDAFYKGNWNRQTVLARGLFIDTINNKIMARSYEKFFKINEVHATELANLKDRLQFPVQAYVKENGFLGIVSYDYKNDDLFIASKSTNRGDYVEYFKKLLEPYRAKILTWYRRARLYEAVEQGKVYADSAVEMTPISLVFECIDQENDPHIIKYDESKIVLLDLIANTLEFHAKPYEDLKKVAELLSCPVKERAFEIKSWDEFRDLYTEVQDEEYRYNDEYIEGFVFVDNTGFMTKCKTGYYNFWKFMRSIADQTLRSGYIRRTGMLNSSAANFFYGFCRELYNKEYNHDTKKYPYKTDIISLRDRFFNSCNVIGGIK